MRLFSLSEAVHFCTSFSPEAGDSERSMSQFVDLHLRSSSLSLIENSQTFDDYRACLLREAERYLFLAASQYRRSLDLMTPASAHWTFVTLYYGNWYAAQALLSMLGGGVYSQRIGRRNRTFVVDVTNGTAGRQELSKRFVGNGPNEETVGASGSHRIFWEIFYTSMTPFRLLVPSPLTVALRPVGGDPLWQIRNRNDVNYKTYEALNLIELFHRGFSSTAFPATLPGILNTQFAVLEAIVELAFDFARQFKLSTDALGYFGPRSLNRTIKKQIYGPKLPALVSRTRKSQIFNA